MARPFSSGGGSSNGIGIGCFLHNPKLTSWNQPPLSVGDYGGGGKKREMMMMTMMKNSYRGDGASLVSSRWNPTAEQVQALEEMYRRGTTTPSAQQIQQIASKLRRFGLSRKDMEIEHPKKLPTILSECNTSSKYLGGEVDECKRDGWTQLELQQQIRLTTETSCRASMDLSSNVAIHKIRGQENAHPFVALNLCKMKDAFEENPTLELFPVRSSGLSTLSSTKEEMDIDVSRLGTKLVPSQFFEFLPTKN
ncbi:WUSCHEL related homeobox 1 [Perilla frutescens var. hirtella]|nr:WUSCHEL related homeobox 1 [Perilla frutescens var. hirtella]KAH6805563.1 WUSCHEL related homeobox 1 [Perilla frutescens var. frutescens]